MTIRSPDAIREPSLPRITSGLRTFALLGALALLGGCSTFGSAGGSETGKASYYGDRHHGQLTASGERFDQNALTAAHRTLPFGTRVRVTNLNNERSVVLRINDRGPFVRGRVIDVSRAAAVRLDMLRAGVVPVRVETLD
ncbi:septal ring lytic transglycosylase RlpA family protein [Pseudomonas chengduensis]|nr:MULTISPECIES: septal ring lytic transglycosylase RlpA family protein [Pseudomonas]MDH0623352.1 septal ring lytic transglycosylase RlpA family protein [Pseudomonas chengduensis]MDH1212749.1 septal ring lytic transglycosylase RlpA family protein [Pseudomonas chengduensis]MDH1281603.1 septal ring lytic transglycosylase RlpA family protein [Pseudomonas chengduensis]MDH1665404.1 septal ring lytic transglycosylase RlpA family protein [Pseudomonas chengduensis]TRO41325.1 septal ring lytic transgly